MTFRLLGMKADGGGIKYTFSKTRFQSWSLQSHRLNGIQRKSMKNKLPGSTLDLGRSPQIKTLLLQYSKARSAKFIFQHSTSRKLRQCGPFSSLSEWSMKPSPFIWGYGWIVNLCLIFTLESFTISSTTEACAVTVMQVLEMSLNIPVTVRSMS